MKVDRREAIRRLGVSAALPIVAAYHPLVPVQQGAWRPRFFDARELDTVVALCERIIPATDTPGAQQALVHQYVDWVLSDADEVRQHLFRDGLSVLERQAGGSFSGISDAERDAVLRAMEDSDFFREAKTLTIEGYYRSDPGMHEELGYAGNSYVSEFDGCTHDDH